MIFIFNKFWGDLLELGLVAPILPALLLLCGLGGSLLRLEGEIIGGLLRQVELRVIHVALTSSFLFPAEVL